MDRRGVKESSQISAYTQSHTSSLSNSFDSVTHVLTGSKLPRGKVQLCFKVAELLWRVERGVPALFRKININQSAVDLLIRLYHPTYRFVYI